MELKRNTGALPPIYRRAMLKGKEGTAKPKGLAVAAKECADR